MKLVYILSGFLFGVIATLLAGWLWEQNSPDMVIRVPGRAPNYSETWS
jgi:hypothetical protein